MKEKWLLITWLKVWPRQILDETLKGLADLRRMI